MITMLVITGSIAAARLAIVDIQLTASSDTYLVAGRESLVVPVTVLTDLEGYVSAIVSCLPGMRAWARSRKGPMGSAALERLDSNMQKRKKEKAHIWRDSF